MEPRKEYYQKQAQVIISNLARRNIEGYYCDNIEEAKEKAAELLGGRKVIGYGGSMSMDDNGFKKYLEEKGHEVIYRENYKTPEEVRELKARTVNCDAFFTSTNAITMDGELINIDGTSNRISYIAYGPETVYFIVGMNKVAPTFDEGMKRARNVAAPLNAIRLDIGTPCTKAGKCMDCLDKNTICCNFLITRYSREKGRIKVILVGEELGY
ncbi:MAG: lactate utilization protein [Erysipelotrichaceae bacterium]|nr:lactate utilization protein [Erysipelotrichaceae bacterium]